MSSSQSSSSAGSNAPFATLSEILSGAKKQSINSQKEMNILPSLEDLQKKLTGSEDSCSKLNFSRAFGLNAFDLDSLNNTESNLKLEKSASINSLNIKEEFSDNKQSLDKHPRQNRRLDSRTSKRNERLNYSATKSEYTSIKYETDLEIKQLINKIENSQMFNFNNDYDDYKDKDIKLKPDFSLIQLPNDFKLENGQVNVYSSGIIQIISGDDPPAIYEFKNAIIDNNILSTDLIITSDVEVCIDKMNILVPATLEDNHQS